MENYRQAFCFRASSSRAVNQSLAQFRNHDPLIDVRHLWLFRSTRPEGLISESCNLPICPQQRVPCAHGCLLILVAPPDARTEVSHGIVA